MASGKLNPQHFFEGARNVAIYVPASELFGWLKRSLDLPVQWAALVVRDTGDRTVIPPGGVVDGEQAEDVFFVRVTPVDVEWIEEGLTTRDRYSCRATVCLRLRLLPEQGELVSFLQAVVGSHRTVQTEGLARYLQPTLRTAVAKLAAEHDADELINSLLADTLSQEAADAAQAPLFAAGLTLDRAPSVRFDSTVLKQVQQQQQEAIRRRAEHQASREVQQALERAQSDHLDHLATLLKRLKELASSSPDVELADLIRSFSQQERGEVYEALFASEPMTATCRFFVVAAGNELLFFDPGNLETPTRRLSVTAQAGPVRSIQSARDDDAGLVLLLGASTGVYRLPIDRTEPDRTLRLPEAPAVHGGFNSVALVGDHVFASHSELGLYEWALADPDAGRSRFESMTGGAKAVRGVQFFDGDLYCSIDNRVIRWPAGDLRDHPAHIHTGSLTTVTSLCPTSVGLFAGNMDGDVLYWPAGRSNDPERLHTGSNRAAESLWLLSSHGVRRLVYTDTSLCVHARVLGDSFLCRYEAGGQTIRRVEVAPDWLVATNELRDRLICWKPGQPAKPSATLAVSRICGHSVQDVCLVPRV